jgi:hypothetical protein
VEVNGSSLLLYGNNYGCNFFIVQGPGFDAMNFFE